MTENTAINREVYGNHACASLLEDIQADVSWHVLWTRSNCEKLVQEQLAAKGYEVFLPLIQQWGEGKKECQLRSAPMFKGYLFLRHAVDKGSYIDIANTRGLVAILGARWDRLAVVPGKEIDAIKMASESGLPTMPYPYLEEGDKVKITKGSLANAEGVLVRTEREKGFFIISVNLLRRSVAVEVDCANVVPV